MTVRLKHTATAFFLTLLFLALSATAHAETILAASSNGSFWDINQNGTFSYAYGQNETHLRTGLIGGSERRSALEFNISGLYAPGMVVEDAHLDLTGWGVNYAGTIGVFGYAGNGTIERTDVLNDAQFIGSINVDGRSQRHDFDIDVTAFLSSLMDNAATFIGFQLKALNGSGYTEIISRTGAATSFLPNDPPELEVEMAATPIPGAVWLLGSGLVGLVGLRKRKK